MSNNSNTNDYNSEEIVKKEARGLGDGTDFGEVQEILGEHVYHKKELQIKNDIIFLEI